MIMELPNVYHSKVAYVENGILFIYNDRFNYEDLMYGLTYALRGRKCVYCQRELTSGNSTLDHRYPRDTGGVSITNNLFPTCKTCNNEKNNMTHQEYSLFMGLKKQECKKYKNDIKGYNNIIKRKIGFKLPRRWVSHEKTANINYSFEHPCFKSEEKETILSKKYSRIKEFYAEYKRLPRPIVVDCNDNLLDGYTVLFFAIKAGIKVVPVIKLENIELLKRT